MSQPYLGEIRLLPYDFEPQGFMTCDGRLLSIAQYRTLYSLLGTTYGGDGSTTFAIPDLRGRVPIHKGYGGGFMNYALGQIGGEETTVLNQGQMGPHRHWVQASTAAATLASPNGAVLAAVPAAQGGDTFYATTAATVDAFAAGAIQPAGGGQAHDNTAPTLPLRFCIAVDGVFPPRNF